MARGAGLPVHGRACVACGACPSCGKGKGRAVGEKVLLAALALTLLVMLGTLAVAWGGSAADGSLVLLGVALVGGRARHLVRLR